MLLYRQGTLERSIECRSRGRSVQASVKLAIRPQVVRCTYSTKSETQSV